MSEVTPDSGVVETTPDSADTSEMEPSTINTAADPQLELSQSSSSRPTTSSRPTSSSTVDPSLTSTEPFPPSADAPQPSINSSPAPAADLTPTDESPASAAAGDSPASVSADGPPTDTEATPAPPRDASNSVSVHAELSFSALSDPSSLTSSVERPLSIPILPVTATPSTIATVQHEAHHPSDATEAEMVLELVTTHPPTPPSDATPSITDTATLEPSLTEPTPTASPAPSAESSTLAPPIVPTLSALPLPVPSLPSHYAEDPLAEPLSSRPGTSLTSRPIDDGLRSFPAHFAYPASHPLLARPLRPFQLPPSYLVLHQSFSYACQQRYNLHYLNEGVLLFIVGNTAHLLDTLTGKKTVLPGHTPSAGGGVASLAVHPSRRLFAVAEKGSRPSIFVYSYPQLAVTRILQGGTDAAYSHCEFNSTGDKLAAVGSAPDYLLSVWDWAHERIILRTKAFSQEVFRVSFSPSNDGRLISSGIGHIRFWDMARTFTGLKLQGQIGKFGAVELSDVAAFAELPDGRVLSGSEAGLLLMWDAHLIQYQVTRADGRPCHAGPVQALHLRGSIVVTAGDDGYIRMWPWTQLEFAEVSEDDPFIRLEPLQEIRIGANVRCLSLVDGEQDEWLVQDSAGAIHSYHTLSQQTRQLLSSHASAIHAVAVSPHSHTAVTAGQDRTLRCWDLFHGTALYSRQFPAAVTALHWAPLALDPGQTTLLAGFEDGTVRAVHRYLEAFVTAASFKPHRHPVTHLQVSPSGRLLASVSAQGDLFFFALPTGGKGEGAQALGCVKLDERVLSLCWDVVSSHVLLGLSGRVLELTAPDPDPSAEEGARDSYVLTLPQREWRYDLRSRSTSGQGDDLLTPDADERRPGASGGGGRKDPPPDLTDEEAERERLRRERRDDRRRRRGLARKEEDERLYDVSQVLYAPHSTSAFYFTLAPPAGSTAPYPPSKVEALYEASFDSPTPSRVIPLGPGFGPVSSLSLSPTLSWLLIGSAAGVVQVRGVRDPLYYFQCHEHDAGGVVRGVGMSSDERLLCSVGSDGGFFAYVVDGLSALSSVDRSVESVVAMEREKRAEERREKARKRAEEEERRRKERRERQLTAKKDDKARGPVVVSDSESEEGEEEEDLSHLSTLIDAAPVVVTSSTPAESATVLLPSPAVDALPTSLAAVEAADGLGAASYSIEEAKAKAEEDERQKELARAQWRIEEEMAECRAQWKAVVEQRAAWEERVRECHFPLLTQSDDPSVAAAVAAISLPTALFDLDPSLPTHVAALIDSKVDTIHSSLAYDLELHQRRLQKLRAAFLDPVEAEAFVVRAFDLVDPPSDEPPLSVWSYRLAHLPPWLTADLLSHQQRRDDEEATRRKADDERQRRQDAEVKEAEQAAAAPVFPSQPTAATGPLPSSLESRYHARVLRQRQIDALQALRPPLHQPTPAHLAVVEEAQRSVGDFKLKSSADYIVPEGRKVNVERVRRRMVSLMDSVHAMKAAFNARMEELRRMKERIKANLLSDHGRIDAISQQLQAADGADLPLMSSLPSLPSLQTLIARVLTPPTTDEWPEHRDSFTDEELHRFIARRKAEEATSKRGAMAEADDVEPIPPPGARPPTQLGDGGVKVEEEKQQMTVSSALTPNTPTPVYDILERTRALLHRRRLRESLVSLVERLYTTLRSFNAALAAEAAAKLRLDDDLLNAELRLLTYCDELGVLKEFEEKERSLEEKGRRMREGKAALIAEMADVERGLQSRMKDLQAGQDKEKQLMAEFTTAVGGEKNEFYSILLKVYRRKVKRKKAKGGAGPGVKGVKGDKKDEAPREDKGGEEDDEDDSDDDDSDAESVSSATSSLHSDSDEDDEEVCPPHCPPVAYERTLELREKRLDNEDSQESLQRVCAEAAKVYERLQAKVKGMEKEEKSVEREMQAFQSDKQRTLNTIEVYLPLQLSQFLHFTQALTPTPHFQLPPTLSDSLLFTRANAERLHSRTGELELERAAIEADFAALKKSGSAVQKEMEEWEGKIEEEKRRCESVQMLKFGRLVDLHFILDDDGGRQRGEEEKRRQLAEMEAANRGVVAKWEEDMGGAKRGYAEQLQLNTRLLERVAELTQAQYALEGKLNASAVAEQVGMGGDGDEAEERREKDELVHLVELQEREIEALKAEMGVLRRKGGHVYTAV